MSEPFNTPKCLALFPGLDKKNDNGKYTCILAFKKGSEDAKFIQAQFNGAMQEFFNGKTPSNFQNPVRNGDEKMYTDKETGEKTVRAGFENSIYFTATTEREVFVVDPTGQQMAPGGMLSHGRYVIANLKTYSWDYQGKEGFSFGLQSIQCLNEIENLPGGTVSVDPLATFTDTTDGKVAPEDDPDNYMKNETEKPAPQADEQSIFG